MNKIITIITPSYNQGKFIKETIESVLSQTGDFFIEYIIADGGSTDNSVDIIKSYETKLKDGAYLIKCLGIDFKWWSKTDNGQADALNQGFKQAKGEIIAWINSDDYYKTGSFQTIINEFNINDNLDLIYGDVILIKDGKENLEKLRSFTFEDLVSEGNLIHQPSVFFKKNTFMKYGPLDPALYYCFDYDFFLNVMKDGKFKYFPQTLSYFRIWPDAKTYKKVPALMNEMEKVRRKYGGKFYDPSNIHRLRHKVPLNYYFRKHFPVLFNFFKKCIYRIIKIFK